MKNPAILLGLSLIFALQAQAADPLFAEMEGHWQGHGVRTYPLSGRKVTVDADVQATLSSINGKPALLSRNRITETEPAATPASKTYLSIYWVQAVDGTPGSYNLGGPGSTQPSSSGVLEPDGSFEVEQELGSGYVVRSKTTFDASAGRTEYSDTFSSGPEIQSQTQIEYQRTMP